MAFLLEIYYFIIPLFAFQINLNIVILRLWKH